MNARTEKPSIASALILRPALYEGAIALLVGLGGLAYVASHVDRLSALWGLGLGSLGLTALGSLLVSRKITIADEAIEFRRMVGNQTNLRLPFAEIRSAGFNDKLRVYEVKTASATHQARVNKDTAKKISKALKDAGFKPR